jgi:hypothetical protein
VTFESRLPPGFKPLQRMKPKNNLRTPVRVPGLLSRKAILPQRLELLGPLSMPRPVPDPSHDPS